MTSKTRFLIFIYMGWAGRLLLHFLLIALGTKPSSENSLKPAQPLHGHTPFSDALLL